MVNLAGHFGKIGKLGKLGGLGPALVCLADHFGKIGCSKIFWKKLLTSPCPVDILERRK
jgi:hypothetical protein